MAKYSELGHFTSHSYSNVSLCHRDSLMMHGWALIFLLETPTSNVKWPNSLYLPFSETFLLYLDSLRHFEAKKIQHFLDFIWLVNRKWQKFRHPNLNILDKFGLTVKIFSIPSIAFERGIVLLNKTTKIKILVFQTRDPPYRLKVCTKNFNFKRDFWKMPSNTSTQ